MSEDTKRKTIVTKLSPIKELDSESVQLKTNIHWHDGAEEEEYWLESQISLQSYSSNVVINTWNISADSLQKAADDIREALLEVLGMVT